MEFSLHAEIPKDSPRVEHYYTAPLYHCQMASTAIYPQFLLSSVHLTIPRCHGIFRRSFHPMEKAAGRGAHGPRNGTCVATDVGMHGSGCTSPAEDADTTGSSVAAHHRFLSAHFSMDNHHKPVPLGRRAPSGIRLGPYILHSMPFCLAPWWHVLFS